MIKNYGSKSFKEIAAELGITQSAVAHKTIRLGLKQREKGRPWTEEEKEFIRQNYRKMPTREIAARLNRSVDSIINSSGPLGISAGPPRPWSDADIQYMSDNYGKIPKEKIAETLGRSVKAVVAMSVKLKLTKRRSNRVKK